MKDHINERFLRVTEVASRYGVSVPTIWRLARCGDFPKPVKLTPAITVWPLSELICWEDQRVDNFRGGAASRSRRGSHDC